ncbi:MAG: PDZ domain-containing protein [Fimbriimonadaceae bacterium]|nr:PDZ domain-containing protein [Fimbriimonadaceae bacterium]
MPLFIICAAALAQAQQSPPTTPPAQQENNPAVTAEQKAEILKSVQETMERRMFASGFDATKWPEFMSKHKEAVDNAETANAFASALNRAFREFGFSHIRLLSPRAATARDNGPRAIGVGLQTQVEEGKGLKITSVINKAPAEEAGLKVGEIIIEIEGKPATSNADLAGPEGTTVKLKVQAADGATRNVEVQRKTYSTARPETLKWVDGDTAVIRIWTFSNGYDRKNIDELMKEAAKAKNLIVDLRSNGGGAVNNMNHFLSLLMEPETVVGTFVNKTMANDFKEKTGGDPADVVAIAKWSDRQSKTRKGAIDSFKGNLAVLINRGSASASEIVAAALKEQRSAVIVGSRSAGAVLASVFGRLPHGFQMQYPVTDYITAMGTRLEGNPIQPDAEAAGGGQDGSDPGVDKAIELLKAKGKSGN